MIYLSENELGFDRLALGFPSIEGCQAVVYVTADGLFGLHNYGGDLERDWPERSAAFGAYVRGHVRGASAGSLLYGVCYATAKLGFSRAYGIKSPKQNWLGELSAFAAAVGFGGPIWGCNLADHPIDPPAYVEFDKVGATCVIQVKSWNKTHAVKSGNTHLLDHRFIRRNTGGEGYVAQETASKVVTSVTQTGLTTVYPEKLRG